MLLALASDRLLPLIRRGFYTPWLVPMMAGPDIAVTDTKSTVFQALSIHVFREGVATSGAKLVVLFKGDEPHAGSIVAYFELTDSAKTQQFKADLLRGQFLVQVTDRGSPRLGLFRWPVLDAETTSLTYNLTEGQGGGVITRPAQIAAGALVDGAHEQRDVLVVERQADGEWRVAGSGSTAPNGAGEIPLEVTESGTWYALGMDDWGAVFEPDRVLEVGQRIRPTQFAGWLYRITEAGTLPATEPEWWPAEGDNASRLLGTARAIAVRYYQPLAHGPLPVELL